MALSRYSIYTRECPFSGVNRTCVGASQNVRLWHKADILSCTAHVRFRGQSGHGRSQCKWPLMSQSGGAAAALLRPPSSQDASVVADVAADDGQERADFRDLRIGDKEIVPIEHNEVGVVPDLDGAEVVLSDEPLVCDGREPHIVSCRVKV